MPSLENLPRRGAWEIDLIEAPTVQIEGEDLRGLLLVAEREGGAVRHATPVLAGEDLAFAVSKAASSPAPPLTPSRPAVIHCRPVLRKELRRIARILGARLDATEDLIMAEAAAESLLQHFSSTPVCLPANPAPWRPLIERLHRAAPWRALPDHVCFHFPSGCAALRDAVAIVLGRAGEQLGLVVYPTQRDHQRFLEMAYAQERLSAGAWEAWAIHLDPLDELPVTQRDAIVGSGLKVGDLGLLLLAMQGDEARPMTEAEEEACMVALQGVLAAYERHGVRLCSQPSITEVPIGSATLTVFSTPEEGALFVHEEPPLILAPHKLMLGEFKDGPALLVKAAKRDAQRLVRELEGVDALSLNTSGPEDEILVWAGERCLGVLSRGAFGPGAWSWWLERGSGHLVISAGGAKRGGIRPGDIQEIIEVELLERDDAPDHDDTNPPDVLHGASWDGPPETWPKASTVLLDFAQPLGAGRLPAEAVTPMLTVASTVWNAVVLADKTGDGRFLDDVRARMAGQGPFAVLTEQLIRRKRELYPQDVRLMVVDGVTPGAGRVDVKVSWRLP
ncbi:MAG: hypothetical protein ABIO70_25485 [Pseudomonadota bacterium]